MGKLEYDGFVHRLSRATVTAFALLGVALLLATRADAQINAAPPSVTSMGFGGRAINPVPPSVTSLGPRGYTPGFNPAFPNSRPSFGVVPGVTPNQPAPDTHHHRHHDYYPWGYAVPYYYPYGYDNSDASANYPDEQYNGGPTIFDPRGPGSVSRPPSAQHRDPSAEESAADTAPAPAQDQPETVLVFKDGHQLEISNYAIVGSTLYDLSEGHRHKVSLADLDLTATVKENDDRGIDFAVPSGSDAN